MDYTEESAINRVKRGGASVNIKMTPKGILKVVNANNVGIRTWGAVDYLRKYCVFR